MIAETRKPPPLRVRYRGTARRVGAVVTLAVLAQSVWITAQAMHWTL